MRPSDSSYDRTFAAASADLLAELKAHGLRVETPVTGAVLVNGLAIEDWDGLCGAANPQEARYEIEARIGEALGDDRPDYNG